MLRLCNEIFFQVLFFCNVILHYCELRICTVAIPFFPGTFYLGVMSTLEKERRSTAIA
jgi:hypothetical protein